MLVLLSRGCVNIATSKPSYRDADLPGDGGALAAGDELGHKAHDRAAPLPGPHVALLAGLFSVNLKQSSTQPLINIYALVKLKGLERKSSLACTIFSLHFLSPLRTGQAGGPQTLLGSL